MAFEFTDEMGTISNNLWAFTSAAGAGVCFLVLLVIGAVSLHPRARIHLDRVSFRIVVYALVTNMLFSIASAVGGTRTGPGAICGFSIFVLQCTLQFSSFLLFCIALNLQLIVVHGVNGQTMEKYYLGLSAIIAIVLVVPPYAAGQYGWDPLERDCWYTNDNRTQRIVWQITTQMAWTALTVLGEVICSIAVLMFMLKHNGRTRRVFVPVRSISETSSSPQVLHVSRYKYIIFRVALYPIASCCVNLLSVATALHSTLSNGIHDRTDYNVLLLSDFLYGGRAIVYALLAASDPALVRGVRTLSSHIFHGTEGEISSEMKSSHSASDLPERFRQAQVFVELTTLSTTNALEPGQTTGAGDILYEVSNPTCDSKSDINHHNHDPKSHPSTDTLHLEPAKSSVHGHTIVGFADGLEDRPTTTATDFQRRHREDQRRQQDERDAFKRQI